MSNPITITESANLTSLSCWLSSLKAPIFVCLWLTQAPKCECGVSYCPPEAVEATDTEYPFSGFSAYVDELSLPFLEEAVIDFVTDKMGSQLTLKALTRKCAKFLTMPR